MRYFNTPIRTIFLLSLCCFTLLSACTSSENSITDSETADTTPTIIAETEAETLPDGIKSPSPTYRDMFDGSAEKGKVTIEYFTKDDLQRVFECIMDGEY